MCNLYRMSATRAEVAQLFGAVESADAAPTPVVMQAWKATAAMVTPLLVEWEKMKAGPR